MKRRLKFVVRVGGVVALVCALMLMLAPIPVVANTLPPPTEVWVDDDYDETTPSWDVTHFDTIEKGIAAVAPGGRVFVADGDYTTPIDTIDIEKPLALLGPGGSTAVVDASCDIAFHIKHSHVGIYGFKIIQCQHGVLVDEGLSGIWIVNNEITDLAGSLANGIHALGGIEGLTISDNTVSLGAAVSPCAAGTDTHAILLEPGIYYDTVISGNELSGTEHGLTLSGVHGESDAKRVQVVDNCIHDIVEGGIWLDSCEFINVEGNILTDNGHGISLNTHTTDGLLYGISIVSNYITDNDLAGIVVGGLDVKPEVVSVNWGGNIDISNNTIVGNTLSGFAVMSTNVFTVDATNNWWGDATGPFDDIGSPPPGDINPTGLGNVAIVIGPPHPAYSFGGPASLIYDPWLTADPYDYPLVVDITRPVTSTPIDLHRTFSVCATITNVSDETIDDVVAKIEIGVGANLVSGEHEEKPLGSIPPAGAKDVCWTLKCEGCGDVLITVTTTPGVCTPTKADSVIVHQPADLFVVVDAPEKVCVCCDDWDVTATIINLGGMTAKDVTATIRWSPVDDASWVSGGSAAAGHPQTIDTIAPLDSVDVVWTLHCDVGEEGAGKALDIYVDVTGTDACEVLDTKATVYQHDELMVVFQTPQDRDEVSTLQEFPVTVEVCNCTTEWVSDIDVDISWDGTAYTNVSWWDSVTETWITPTSETVGFPPTQTIDALCPCCCEEVTWLVRCEVAGNVTFTVTAISGELSGENSITIIQVVKTHLDAKEPGFIMPTSDSTFAVCDDFVVMVRVRNTGDAAALDVSGTIELPTAPKTSLVAGETPTKTIPEILGGEYGTFVWKLHCDECGIEMIKVVDIGGTDENTGEAILADNIQSPTPICPRQLGLGVDIISPTTCTNFDVSDTFCVEAVVTNLPSPCSELEAVTATLNIYGPAELVGEESEEKIIGIVPRGGTQEVEWTVHCAGRGDVKFTVTANASEPYEYSRTSDLVIVHQQKVCPPPELIQTHHVGLNQGWNLISLPLIPEDPTIETVLDGVDVQKVAGYSPFQDWKYYTPGAPSDLTQMNDGWGYWIDMGTGYGALIVSGYELVGPPPAVPPYYELVEGWNLIGFKSTMPKAPEDYLGPDIVGKCAVIYGFADGRYFLVGSPGWEELQPGLGYWIAMIAPGTIYP